MKTIRQKILWGIAILFIGLFIFYVYKCPIKLFFRIDCPGCGMTRAYKALLRLDFQTAFSYHELFPIPFIVLVYQIFRKKFSIGEKNELISIVMILIMFFVRWIIKIFF